MDLRRFKVRVYHPADPPYGKEVIHDTPYDAARSVVGKTVRPGTKIGTNRWHFMVLDSDKQWVEIVVDELPKEVP